MIIYSSKVHMLTLSLASPVHYLTLEVQKVTSQITLRMAVVIASVALILTSGITLAALAAGVPSCAVGESLLVYPHYNQKGVAQNFSYRCGQPHATCGLRPIPLKNAPTYDCSPFMLPRGE
jgi:hypothetical protein